ncbi:hypothetical protein EC957_010318 [Mortierella hygrophila]|uniref:Tail specific protease domain-containing protein n=1 Tax=Mortierella hygrophila TaxID=979708 RepID=A0A9P6EWS5_9FUNG|nr:hypothetical protein EC957_010318 [Mortierella hygrophila]
MAFRTLILSLTVAALATISFAEPSSSTSGTSGCSDLASRLGVNITYTEVAKCFDSIPFNKEAAKATLESVATLFNDYCISRDAAMAPFLAKPLQSDPVDIVAKFKRIGRTQYTSDRKFHTDIYEAIESLHDGHAMYFPYCYMAYHYEQPLSLYAPVVNGKQVLKVFQDRDKRGYEDCTVIKIDGENAMAQVMKRANLLFNSKDPNVRLNEALASLQTPPLPYATSAGSLPKRDLTSFKRHEKASDSNKQTISVDRLAQAATPPVPSPPTLPVYPEAIKIGAGNCTVFHQLKDRLTVGILTLFVTTLEFAENDFMYQSLETLYQQGVTEIIIDVVGGNGGYANVASDFVHLLFPSNDSLDKVIRLNFQSTSATQELSAKVHNSTDGGWSQIGNMISVHGGIFYDSSRFFDLANNHTYTNNSLYTDTVTHTRNGRKAVYTKTTAYKPATQPNRPKLAKYPWTNNPSRIRILTDGRCLSGCGYVIFFIVNQYGVKSYGVGGTKGELLSKYQYVAGAGSQLKMFNGIFAFANTTSPIKDLPYQSVLSATVGEIVAPGSKVPLEFDSDKYPTDFRLDFDPVNARSREALWTQVAEDAWN